VPERLCWPVLRLVNRGHDYHQIKTKWSLPMVLRANEALDLQDDAERLARRNAEKQAATKKAEENGGIW